MSHATVAAKLAAPASRSNTTHSRRLPIGEPADYFEQEADRIADQVMATGTKRDWSLSHIASATPTQRKCACKGASSQCDECKAREEESTGKKQAMQRKASASLAAEVAPPIVHEVLQSNGQPLDKSARDFFESRFGYDFAHVRVHTDEKAGESARAVQALAYTVGGDMVFAPGQYAPGTAKGKALLAHELTHTLQQQPAANASRLVEARSASERSEEWEANAAIPRARMPVRVSRAPEARLAKEDDTGPRFLVPLQGQAEPEFDEKPDCLKQFTSMTMGSLFKRIDARRVAFEAPFAIAAEFTRPCKCSELEYRQYIRGHIIQDPDGKKVDRGDLMSGLPLGRLWETFQEDGNTALTPVHYGHRDEAASSNPKAMSQYTDADGTVNQKNGCHFESSDTPFAFFYAAPGETWDIQLDSYGDIQRNGKPIQRRHWTPIKGRFVAP